MIQKRKKNACITLKLKEGLFWEEKSETVPKTLKSNNDTGADSVVNEL